MLPAVSAFPSENLAEHYACVLPDSAFWRDVVSTFCNPTHSVSWPQYVSGHNMLLVIFLSPGTWAEPEAFIPFFHLFEA